MERLGYVAKPIDTIGIQYTDGSHKVLSVIR